MDCNNSTCGKIILYVRKGDVNNFKKFQRHVLLKSNKTVANGYNFSNAMIATTQTDAGPKTKCNENMKKGQRCPDYYALKRDIRGAHSSLRTLHPLTTSFVSLHMVMGSRSLLIPALGTLLKSECACFLRIVTKPSCYYFPHLRLLGGSVIRLPNTLCGQNDGISEI